MQPDLNLMDSTAPVKREEPEVRCTRAFAVQSSTASLPHCLTQPAADLRPVNATPIAMTNVLATIAQAAGTAGLLWYMVSWP
jgi:hypothetical protein